MDADGAVRDFLDRLHAGVEWRLQHPAHRHPVDHRNRHRARLGLVDEEMGRVEGEGVTLKLCRVSPLVHCSWKKRLPTMDSMRMQQRERVVWTSIIKSN